MALEDILTLPLKVAQDLLAQPLRTSASPEAYADERDAVEFESNLPNFFRQAAQQIAESEAIRQAQEKEFAARMVVNEAGPDGELDTYQGPTAKMQQALADYAAGAQQAQAEVQPPTAVNPAVSGMAPSIINKSTGGFFGKVGDIATDVLSPVGHAVERGIEGVGQGLQAVGADTVGTAVENLPLAAAKFKETFGEEFQKKTGQPLNLETALTAINQYGARPLAAAGGQAIDYATDRSIDPLLRATLPDSWAEPMIKAVDFAGYVAPYVALTILAPEVAAPLDLAFALSASDDIKNLYSAYREGQIDGRTFLLGAGLSSLDIAGPIAGHYIGRSYRGWKSQREVARAVEDINKITGRAEGASQLTRGINAAEELQRAPESRVLGEALRGEGVPQSRVASALDALDVADSGPEGKALEGAAESAEAAPAPEKPKLEIREEPQSPVDVRTDRHRLVTPEGDRLDYRGTHIQDVTVQVEREGRGSALLARAIEDIRSRDPKATITADLNSEGGARLMARLPGVQFYDNYGNALTPDEAIAAAIRREGPLAELPPGAATPEVPAPKVEEPVAAIGREVEGPEQVARPVEAEAKKGDGWTKQTHDKVERRRLSSGNYSEVWERRDGKFDFVDRRWATGTTAGARDAIQTFDTLDEAQAAAENLEARFARPPEQRLESFREEARQELAAQGEREKVGGVEEFPSGPKAPETDVTREAERVAREAQPQPTPEEEVRDVLRPRQRPVREATEVARAEQTFRRMVDDTLGEQGGATYNPRTGEPVPYKDYFVEGYAPSKQVKASEFGPTDLTDFIRENFDVFRDPNISIGTERVTKDGVDYINIDAVRNLDDKAEALRIGKANGEERIWDANNDAPIDVPGTKKTATSVRAEKTPEQRFFDGETGALDLDRIGTVVRDWIRGAGDAVKRVIEYVKTLGRQFRNDELGAIMLGRKKVEGMEADDILDFGGARRWLHPEESWETWAREMRMRVGGTEEFWMSHKGNILSHVEKQMGLLGEGQQGTTAAGVAFGREAGPTTFDRLKTLYDEGRALKQKGQYIDMAKWYDNFWKVMKDNFGDDAEMMTRIMAATQMNNAPAGGVPIAMRAYLQWKMGEPISRMGSRTIRNEVESFLMGNVPHGDKIGPFWEALRFGGKRGKNAVAVDRWVILALGGKAEDAGAAVKRLQGNSRFIRFSQAVVASAADEAHVSPRAFQAAIWGGFRSEWDRLLKAAGGRPMGGDNDFFENLLVRKLKEYAPRSPSDFRLNVADVTKRDLFDLNPEVAEVEFWQKMRAEEGAKLIGTSPKNYDAMMNDIMYAEWNKKIAAAHMLDTGEIPAHLRTPEVIDDVKRAAEHYRRAFQDRIGMADDKTLKSLKDIPEWQKREVTAELDRRARTGEQVTAAWTALPAAERQRLTSLGWMAVPDDPRVIARAQKALQELDAIKTEDEFVRWANRKANRAIVGDPKAFTGKMLKTGETYEAAAGRMTEKTAASPYYEPRSFWENRLVFNVEKAKEAIRARFPDSPPLRRRGAAALGIIEDSEGLGACGASAADAAF